MQAVQSSGTVPEGSSVELGWSVDGRSARRIKGRAAAIEAVLELFDEGEPRPGTDLVVARAGISSASLFRYFRSLDDLYRAAFEEQLDRAEVIARIVDLEGRDVDDRIDAFVSGRIAVYRSVTGVGRMARARSIDDPGIARGLERARARWLAQVRVVFRPELSTRSRRASADLAAVLDALTSFEVWDLLANGRGLTNAAVSANWATAIRALLA